ncbi:hypothetical protein C0Q70_11377 [Pomacea canaliculata]|uniref:Uncharacterized protein n=1 Tax=Pomacea canaliculata TaxID=400727 RepID=A0A2T7P5S2_POMCA|nr:uncharacterized protein LOC112566622 [Pomacea canaliculata]PVD28782.1 hypothetical protein C0Q70_11377 [Pomacea canaliculata]
MKIIAALALLAVAVHARFSCPPDPTQGIDCFETEPDQLFCMSDGNLVCGTCGMRLAFCLGLVEGVIIIQTNDPAVCAGAIPPECPTGNSQQRPGGQGGQGGHGGHGNPFGIPPGLNKPKN